MAEFKQGHQFLKKREQHLLDQLSTLEQLLTEGREKFKTRGVSELGRLTLVISELEGKARQPAAELMQVRGWASGRQRSARSATQAFEEIPPPGSSVLLSKINKWAWQFFPPCLFHISLNTDMESL